MASRSADSTEDSLGESNLSPETTEKHAYQKGHKSKNESGDYLSSDSSEFTDSDELSSDVEGDGESRANRGFVPIQIPDVQVDDADAAVRKKPIKTEARRMVKSESDRSLLSVEERQAGCSREGSVSKFRADGSWIKPPDEGEEEGGVESDMQASGTVSDESGVKSKEASVEKEEGLWMDIGTEAEQMADSETLESDKEGVAVEIDTGVDEGTGDPYLKENIPWNPGTVLKQKEDIERYGSFSGSLPSAGKNTESVDSGDVDVTKSIPDDSQEGSSDMAAQQQPVIRIESGNQTSESCDTSDQSGKAISETGQSGSSSDNESGEPASRESRKSVYEEEEIDLPEGIVRKTKMEIEERNR